VPLITQMAQQPGIANCPIIASTYSARTTELIYRHLLKQLESDDAINKSIKDIMSLPPLQIGPPFTPPSPAPKIDIDISKDKFDPIASVIALNSTTGSTSTIAGSEITINANAETIQPAVKEPVSKMEPPNAEPPSRRTSEQVLETLEKEIKRWYDSLKHTEFEQYLQHIRHRFETRNDQSQTTVAQDSQILKAQLYLDQWVGVADKELKLKLGDST
jgi:hypothetical protein